MLGNRFLSISSLVVGGIYFLLGIKNVFSDNSSSLEIQMGNVMIAASSKHNDFYTYLIYFFGSICLIVFAIFTFNFCDKKIDNSVIDEKIKLNLTNLNKWLSFCAISYLLITIFFIISDSLLMISILINMSTFWQYYLVYSLVILIFDVLPLLLIIKVFKQNNKVLKIQKQIKNKVLIEKINQLKIKR